ncbi:MAG TPA: amidohydrolase family protein [Bryobacteraceae bacterium]|nr:amidohydrolase family protein [Bryobacteraceae bacterium]
MQTPWGDFPVRDAHVHFFSPAFFASLAAQSGKPLDDLGRALDWELPGSTHELAARWKAELDDHGVAQAALIASIPGDEDSVSTAVVAFPGRFFGYFMANPALPDGAARVRHALASGRMQGVCLFPAMHRYAVGDPRVRPVIEAAAAHPGTIVFVHCGVLTIGVRRKLGLASLFDMRYSNPIDLHAVAAEFPQVNFVVPHFGAGYFREALMLCDLCPNVYLDTSSSNSWVRYQVEPLDLQAVFRRALAVAGPRRLLFGTDSSFFPRGWHTEMFDAQVHALSEMDISAEHAKLIFGGNLERLLSRTEATGLQSCN